LAEKDWRKENITGVLIGFNKPWQKDEQFIKARQNANTALKFIPLSKMKEPFKLVEYENRNQEEK
jgi:hypothetical protein